MKKLIISICLLFAFFIPVVTKAADGKLKSGDFEMECVYDNGSSITTFYDGTSYIMQYSDFKLANAITPPFKSAITVFYNENEWGKTIIQDAACPDSLVILPVTQTNDSNSVGIQVVVQSEYATAIPPEFFTKQHVGGFQATSYAHMWFELEENSPLYRRGVVTTGGGTKKGGFEFYLVAERIYFNSDVEPYDSFAFKHEGPQASSTPVYFKQSQYYNEKGYPILVIEKDGVLTPEESYYNRRPDDIITVVCLYESLKNIKKDHNDMAYYFTRVRHDSVLFRDMTGDEYNEWRSNGGYYECGSGGSEYISVSMEEYEENATTATSICEVIPETALLISAVIYYLGIFIPILLIIFTTIDIAKLVISGNLDEELPKKKKMIITRFIVAVVFFFIPILMNIFVSSRFGTDFGNISCLFTKNESDENESDENESDENESDENESDESEE